MVASVKLSTKVAVGSRGHHRLQLRWNPSLCYPSHGYHLLGRLLQTGRRLANGCYHRQQECLGLRFCRVHHPMGPQGWLCASDHDQRQLDHSLVLVRHTFLLFWKDFPQMVEEQLRASTLNVR